MIEQLTLRNWITYAKRNPQTGKGEIQPLNEHEHLLKTTNINAATATSLAQK